MWLSRRIGVRRSEEGCASKYVKPWMDLGWSRRLVAKAPEVWRTPRRWRALGNESGKMRRIGVRRSEEGGASMYVEGACRNANARRVQSPTEQTAHPATP